MTSASRISGPPAELQQQAEVVTDGAMASDLAIGNGEDVHLFVGDRPAGRCDAVERSGVLSGHHGGGHHGATLGDGFLKFKVKPAAFHEGRKPLGRAKLPVHGRSSFRSEGTQRGQLGGIQ